MELKHKGNITQFLQALQQDICEAGRIPKILSFLYVNVETTSCKSNRTLCLYFCTGRREFSCQMKGEHDLGTGPLLLLHPAFFPYFPPNHHCIHLNGPGSQEMTFMNRVHCNRNNIHNSKCEVLVTWILMESLLFL